MIKKITFISFIHTNKSSRYKKSIKISARINSSRLKKLKTYSQGSYFIKRKKNDPPKQQQKKKLENKYQIEKSPHNAHSVKHRNLHKSSNVDDDDDDKEPGHRSPSRIFRNSGLVPRSFFLSHSLKI